MSFYFTVRDQSINGITVLTPGCLVAKMFTFPAIVPFFHGAYQANAPLLTVMVEIVLYALYAIFFYFLVWRGREHHIWIICAGAYLGGVAVAALVVQPFWNECLNLRLVA